MIDKESAMRELLADMSEAQRGLFLIQYLRRWRSLSIRRRRRLWQYEAKVTLTPDQRADSQRAGRRKYLERITA